MGLTDLFKNAKDVAALKAAQAGMKLLPKAQQEEIRIKITKLTTPEKIKMYIDSWRDIYNETICKKILVTQDLEEQEAEVTTLIAYILSGETDFKKRKIIADSALVLSKNIQ